MASRCSPLFFCILVALTKASLLHCARVAITVHITG